LKLAEVNVDFGGFFKLPAPDKLAEKSIFGRIFMLFF